MMKMILPASSLLFFNKKMNMFMIITPFIMFTLITKTLNKMQIMNNSFLYDKLTTMMILLTMISTTLIILSSNSMKSISPTILPIFIILILTFSTSNLFHFYILFETVLIPTLILITSLGKQSERLQAGIYLIIYTIVASLPLLINILLMKNNPNFMMMQISMQQFNLPLLLILAFLVKTPMFFTHLWLPKAHVEAPLEGSMILAAILLKLGGYGLIRVIPLCMMNMHQLKMWILSISILGASMTSLNCMRQKDMKSLIAYSSVAHMALTLASILTMNNMGLMGAIIMMIAHGFSSSALFLLVNDLYMKIHSRNILLFKGLLSISPNITFWWFMFMAINMSAPPTINTMSEIFIISSLITWSNFMLIPIILASFLTASFSFSLFINISHNKNEMKPFKSSPHKIFLSLFIHMIPLIMMIPKMETMMQQ